VTDEPESGHHGHVNNRVSPAGKRNKQLSNIAALVITELYTELAESGTSKARLEQKMHAVSSERNFFYMQGRASGTKRAVATAIEICLPE
jgi:hypothetical protein